MPHSWTLWWWSRKCTNSTIKANSCCPLLCINLQLSCSALDWATGHVLMNTIYHILHLPQKEAGMQLRNVHVEEILGVSESILVYTLFMQLGHHAWLSALTLPVDKILIELGQANFLSWGQDLGHPLARRVSRLNHHKRCHLSDVILVFLVYQMIQKIQNDSWISCLSGWFSRGRVRAWQETYTNSIFWQLSGSFRLDAFFMNRLQTGGIAHNMPIFSEVETSLGKQIDWICR